MKLAPVAEDLIVSVTGEEPRAVRPVSGGSVNQAARVETASHILFVKWRAGVTRAFFDAEAEGLKRLAVRGSLRVPMVRGCADDEAGAALAMDWIEAGPSREGAMVDAGRQLAHLHAERGLSPGLEVDNFIGPLPQRNASYGGERWPEFFRRQRLDALAGALSTRVRCKLDAFDVEPFCAEPAGGCALLHGDLWAGNLVSGQGQRAWFVDPAIYCGHPEVDLAMTRLFGGFTARFYRAYEEIAGPLDKEWTERAEVLNLYPLLVHVHLFGAAYEAQVEGILERYGGG